MVLTLNRVIFRHKEYKELDDFLIKQYGFYLIEESEKEISKTKEVKTITRGDTNTQKEIKTKIFLEEGGKKTSSNKIFEGNHMDNKIRINILGDLIHIESIMEIEDEKYKIYTVEYQMIKLSSESGYSLQRFLEKLISNLGLSIGAQKWSFHREIIY